MIQIYFKCLNDRSKIGRQDVGAIPTTFTNTPWTSQVQIISVTEPYIKYVYIGGEIGSTGTIKATGETGAQAALIARKQ